MDRIAESGTGVLVQSCPSCPSCQNIFLPVLIIPFILFILSKRLSPRGAHDLSAIPALSAMNRNMSSEFRTPVLSVARSAICVRPTPRIPRRLVLHVHTSELEILPQQFLDNLSGGMRPRLVPVQVCVLVHIEALRELELYCVDPF